MSDEQKKQLEGFQKEVSAKLEKLLTEDQQKQLKESRGGFGGGLGGLPQPGQIMTPFQQSRLKLSDEQKKLFGIDKLNVPRSTIPAVTHVDYSARIQSVDSRTNPQPINLHAPPAATAPAAAAPAAATPPGEKKP